MNLHDPLTYAGEKGGANRDLIMNSPVFARTRENMNDLKNKYTGTEFLLYLCKIEKQTLWKRQQLHIIGFPYKVWIMIDK